MNETSSGGTTPVKYTIRIDSISDIVGYAVEIIDRYNYKTYSLSGVYTERELAVKEADKFVNDLFEQEISMFIN